MADETVQYARDADIQRAIVANIRRLCKRTSGKVTEADFTILLQTTAVG